MSELLSIVRNESLRLGYAIMNEESVRGVIGRKVGYLAEGADLNQNNTVEVYTLVFF